MPLDLICPVTNFGIHSIKQVPVEWPYTMYMYKSQAKFNFEPFFSFMPLDLPVIFYYSFFNGIFINTKLQLYLFHDLSDLLFICYIQFDWSMRLLMNLYSVTLLMMYDEGTTDTFWTHNCCLVKILQYQRKKLMFFVGD